MRVAFFHHPHYHNAARLETMPFAWKVVEQLQNDGHLVDLYLWENTIAPYKPSSSLRVIQPFSKFPFHKSKFMEKIYQRLWYRLPHRLDYKLVFGSCAIGACEAAITAQYCRAPWIYLNDEFPETFHQGYWRKREKVLAKTASMVIVPDICRKTELYSQLDISPSTTCVEIPNSPQEIHFAPLEPILDKLQLKPDQRYILHAGTVSDWSQIPEILSTLPLWNKDVKLVIHSHTHNLLDYKKSLRHLDNPERIIWSTTPLNIDELHSLIKHSLGSLALYRDDGLNTELIGKSSGKLARSIMIGTPVIASDFSSLQFVSQYKIGINVQHPQEIPQAVQTLIDQGPTLRQNCIYYAKKHFDFSDQWNLIKRLAPIP